MFLRRNGICQSENMVGKQIINISILISALYIPLVPHVIRINQTKT